MSKLQCPDNHLQSAIQSHQRDLFLNRLITGDSHCPKYILDELNCFHRLYIYRWDHVELDNEHTYALWFNPLIWNYSGITQKFLSAIMFSVSLGVAITEQLQQAITVPNIFQDLFEERWTGSSTLLQYLRAYIVFQNIRDKMQDWVLKIGIKPGVYKVPEIGTIYYTRTFCYFDCTDGLIMYDYTQILMLLDTLYARYQAFLHMYLYWAMEKIIIIPPSLLDTVYLWGDEFLLVHGNKAYNSIKLLEALCFSEFIRRYDTIPITQEFPQKIHTEYISAHEDCYHSDIIEVLSTISSSEWMMEIHGLFRHWGHPTVDETKRVEKVCRIADESEKSCWRWGRLLRAALTRAFVLKFIGKHGRWPSCNIALPIKKSVIQKFWKKGITNIDEFARGYNWEDWGYFSFNKESNFDPYIDFSVLLDDKSISPPRSKFDSVFHPSLLKYRQPDKLSPHESRRVLLNILGRDNFSTEEILYRIQARDIPWEWLVIGVHSKERELKIEPRLFAMMTLEMRYYFCITEKNLADHFFEYLDQQTMTSSETELTHRMMSLTSLNQKSGDPGWIFVSLDYSSWNIRWNLSGTYEVFNTIDELFGTPGLWTYTHQFFQDCMVYLSSTLNPPHNLRAETRTNPRECIGHLWYEHFGGFEGLRQKGWTATTIAMIELAHLLPGTKERCAHRCGQNSVVF